MHLAKKTLLYLSVIFSNILISNSQLRFDFEDGVLKGWQQSNPGRWEASAIEPINGIYSLHHIFDNDIADNDQISYPYDKSIDMNEPIHWSFRVRHTYSPSSANHWTFFLVADKPAIDMLPGSQINAIAVGVNFAGSDDILKIWKIENGNPFVVLQSDLNWQSSIADSSALILIDRYPDNNWDIKISSNGNPDEFKTVGNGLIDYFPETNHFGIYYKYSSSQDQKLWIDDILIDATFIVDTIKPFIDTAIISESSIELQFNEPVDITSIDKNNFVVKPSNRIPDTIIKIGDRKLKLNYAQKFVSGDSILFEVTGVKDLNGNIMLPYTKRLFFYIASIYDILITEIMADPDPQIGLPQYEYLELYNRSSFPVNLKSWRLSSGSNSITFPEYVMQSKNYLILCVEKARQSFEKYGKVLDCLNDTYFLTNSGASLTLVDSNQNIISFVNYCDCWYDDEYKKSGGWSLEMIDPENPCSGKDNWLPSIDKSGGTPGRQNSVWRTNPDNSIPEFLYIQVPGDDSIILHFSEPLNIHKDSMNFFMDGGIGYPVRMYTPFDNFSSVILIFSKQLEPGKNYQLLIKNNVSDCAGNTLTDNINIPVAIPQQPDSFDVIINEVLFNPFSQGSEFIEIFNRSGKTIDAGSMVISIKDISTGMNKTSFPIVQPGYLMYPGTYIAVTTNMTGLEKFYQLKSKKSVIEQYDFPSLPDEKGIITLKNVGNKTLDKFEYNSSMHFALLSNDEGVSLERLQTDQPTQSTANWHSASQSAGYATPGYMNSQYSEPANKKEERITIEPDVFTPDNDGKDDFVIIGIKPELQGNTITINIFNASGILVRHLVGKQYLGSVNNFIWDGTTDDHKLEPPGIYVIFTQLLNETGQSSEFKNVCILGK